MIDLTLLRQEPEHISSLIKHKEPTYDVEQLITLDEQVRELRLQVEELRHKKNELAQQGKKEVTDVLREESKAVGKKLKEKEDQLLQIQQEFIHWYLHCPNIPQADVPIGDKEHNVIVREYGKKPSFDFESKNHLELGAQLGWFDFEAAAQMTGTNFALYKGEGVQLLYALTLFMLKHNASHGFNYILPPYLVNEQSLIIASNFPKFRDQVYAVQDEDLYLSPTAEVNLANLYRKKIFAKDELPIRLTTWTSCFRREAGTYGHTERGLIRLHEFEKVELFTYCTPEDVDQELDRMLHCAQELLQKLDLHYRVSLLSTQECSFPSSKTYDLEVWLPGQDAYYEVSSVSNCTDFQSRRGQVRYREKVGSKTHYVYTLNGSSLAIPRLMVAIMETYQQSDGSITIPEVLKGYGLY